MLHNPGIRNGNDGRGGDETRPGTDVRREIRHVREACRDARLRENLHAYDALPRAHHDVRLRENLLVLRVRQDVRLLARQDARLRENPRARQDARFRVH